MARAPEDNDGGLDTTFTPSGAKPIPTSAISGSGSGNKRFDKNAPVLHVGRVLGDRWQVGDRIGMGGMASVHRGVDLRLGRPVAIKILHPHVAENVEARTRLAREARAIAQLKHENVIEVYDYSSDDPDCTWLVTELVEGVTLRGLLDKRGKVMPEIAAIITAEVLRALRVAHSVGVIHRDVKPDNVLVGRDGRPKLSDFGIAQIVDEQRMTVTGNLVGSPSYMSPEQAEGRRTDHRTDLFSAGIMLYRMVCGQLPFAGANAIETLRKVAAVIYLDPMEVEPSCPGSVAAVIRRALAPAIEARYQSADEMLADLSAVGQEAGFATPVEELQRYFEDPEAFEVAVGPQVARALFSRGKTLLQKGEEARALDCFTRARALGVSDEQSLDLVRVLSERRDRSRSRRVVLSASLAAVLVGIIGGGLFASGSWGFLDGAAETPPAPAPVVDAAKVAAPIAEVPAPAAPAPAPAKIEESPVVVDAVPAAAPAAKVEAPADDRTSSSAKKKRRENTVKKEEPKAEVAAPPAPPPPVVEAPKPAEPERGTLRLGLKGWADIYVNGVKLGRAPDQNNFTLPAGTYQLRAVNPMCEPLEREITIVAGETTRERLSIECP